MTFDEVCDYVRQRFAGLIPGDGRCVVEARETIHGREEPRVSLSWCDHRRGIYVARSWADDASPSDVRSIVDDARRQVEAALRSQT